MRDEYRGRLSHDGTVTAEVNGRLRWWTFAGGRANGVLSAALGHVAPELVDTASFSSLQLSLRSVASAAAVASAMRTARSRFGDDLAGIQPEVTAQALEKLKFSELLPPALARCSAQGGW